jgi:hypothetical protein
MTKSSRRENPYDYCIMDELRLMGIFSDILEANRERELADILIHA